MAGMLPLYLPLSSRQLRLMTVLGTGILVGTSLIVIIPEGVETLYAADAGRGSQRKRSLFLNDPTAITSPLVLGATMWQGDITTMSGTGALRRAGNHDASRSESDDDFYISVTTKTQRRSPLDEQLGEDADGNVEDSPSDETDDGVQHDPHAWVGVSLIAGFILMYLIDTLPQQAFSSSTPQHLHISLNNMSFNRSASITSEADAGVNASALTSHKPSSSRPSSTTVGLVIHGCADGIALGASSTTTSPLTFIIFLALIVHKAPAAFGLTSVLLKQGLSTRMARAHLIVFSLAAPFGALLTWAAAHLLGYSEDDVASSMSTEFATGVLLLFSGGTFLYVAMHTMQESAAQHEHGLDSGANGYAVVPMTNEVYPGATSPRPPRSEMKIIDTAVCAMGMLLPLLTQFGHGH